jgi:hypothetical protein
MKNRKKRWGKRLGQGKSCHSYTAARSGTQCRAGQPRCYNVRRSNGPWVSSHLERCCPFFDENHSQAKIGGHGHGGSSSWIQYQITVDPDTGELLPMEDGGVMPRRKERVEPKYTKDARSCCCTQILYFVNRVTNVWVDLIVMSFDQIVGTILGIQIFLLLRIYLSINVSWYRGVDKTKQQSNTRFSI